VTVAVCFPKAPPDPRRRFFFVTDHPGQGNERFPDIVEKAIIAAMQHAIAEAKRVIAYRYWPTAEVKDTFAERRDAIAEVQRAVADRQRAVADRRRAVAK